ncbi:MAG: hypothetical protein AB1489_09825 [Acidobacteriota bacterium]
MESLSKIRSIGAEAYFDGVTFTLRLKRREAQRLLSFLNEDIGELRPVIPTTIISLAEALEKALARTSAIPLWKTELGCFAWQRNGEWIELRLHEKEFKNFLDSATAMPRFTRDPGPPSPELDRRWPCLSDIALLMEMLPAMHRRRGLKFGRRASLEIAAVFRD